MCVRRQLSMFLPEPQRAMVDAVRRRFDPHQHSIIPAHVTLCRDEETEAITRGTALLAAPPRVAVTLAFAAPVRRDDGCVLLPVRGATDSFDALRRELLGEHCRPHQAHVTLMHPRNVASTSAELALILACALPGVVHLDELQLIEQVDGGPWKVLARYRA